MEESITIQTGMFEVTLSKEEVKELYEDTDFLEQAILAVLNPVEAAKSDLRFAPEQYRELLKVYFLEKDRGYSIEFLKKIFFPTDIVTLERGEPIG
jgi:hypothetical protein